MKDDIEETTLPSFQKSGDSLSVTTSNYPELESTFELESLEFPTVELPGLDEDRRVTCQRLKIHWMIFQAALILLLVNPPWLSRTPTLQN